MTVRLPAASKLCNKISHGGSIKSMSRGRIPGKNFLVKEKHHG